MDIVCGVYYHDGWINNYGYLNKKEIANNIINIGKCNIVLVHNI